MQGKLTIPKIKQKFTDLKYFDSQYKRTHTEQKMKQNFQQTIKGIVETTMIRNQVKNEKKGKKISQKPKQIIYTKSDICQEISKLKPYLDINSGVALEDLNQEKDQQNTDYSQLQYKKLCQMIIYYNRKLCEKLTEVARLQQQLSRHDKQKQGWVFEIYYRSTSSSTNQLQSMGMNSGYAVLTDIVQIFESLTFDKPLISISMKSVSLVKYSQDMIHDIIQIKHSNGIIQIGFINNSEFKLFDRMLFLQKNMARSSSTRLFQSQLLKSIYQQFS